MAWRSRSRIDRRQAILGMLAAGGARVLPAQAAVPAPDTPAGGKAYVAFFLGQGGYLFSWGIPYLESEARKLGLATDVFAYTDLQRAWANIVRRRQEGYKIALVGYSLGNTTATYLQQHLAVDLLLAIAESSLGQNHTVRKENTKRSVLWYGPDTLSNGGVRDGFDEINYVESQHLFMDLDPRVVRGVLDELRGLVAPERRDEKTMVAARAPAPGRGVTPVHDKIAAAPVPADAPPQRLSANWLPPTNVITPDVTCKKCWGFTQSPAGPDPWIQ